MNTETCYTLSVIIPLFNQEQYIKECLNVFLGAGLIQYQLIIIDDFSSDNSVAETEEWINQPGTDHLDILFLKNDINLGVCKTLNKALLFAKHDIVVLCAADDVLIPSSFASKIFKLKTSNYDALISDVHIINEKSILTMGSAFKDYFSACTKALSSKKYLAGEIITNWCIPGPSLMIKKNVYEKIGAYNESLIAEDRDFYLRLFNDCNVAFDFSPVASYRIHSMNISRSSHFRNRMNNEIKTINVKYADKWSGIARWYLLSYGLGNDNSLTGRISLFTSRVIRKFLRFLFISKVYMTNEK